MKLPPVLLAACFSCLVLGAGILFARHIRPHQPRSSSEQLAHERNEFEFTVHFPYKLAAPLFGAYAERAWAGPLWEPHFLYPQNPPHDAYDVPGAVFTIAHSHFTAVWVNTVFDLEAGHVQYVYFIPEHMTTRIDIHMAPRDDSSSTVKVAYERTAITTEANAHVRAMALDDRQSGPHWGDAIDQYLAGSRPAAAR
jgi:hypothetical protein